ncbi:DpnD/PcfM family protein [Clostridium botulinum]|uniref:DpnD/PcfM family protein n=1 Tax=Clostridium botulinum TaxID=1491 RepID=UPI001C9A661A|nr:DpnD/PcfM family protein [Clostridium botulinum]MBY6838768.1 hypothetical protein [Clostridium botulinum]
MGKFKVRITETYVFNVEIEAKSKKEALEKVKKDYDECDESGIYDASATSYDNTKFKVE